MALSSQEIANIRRGAQRATAPKKRGRGGTLTSLISELGGAGGAAGGAAIGTAIAPGIGTLAGAILGGFAGGTSGRVAENKVRDNRVGFYEALKEGALTGALSGIGPGYQLAKAGKGAKALGALSGAKIPKNFTGTAETGALEQKGLNITSKSGGYFTGASVPGNQPLAPSKVKEYDQLLRKLKIGANDANDLSINIEQRLKALGGQLDKSIQGGNRALGKAEVDAFRKTFVKQVADTPGLSKEANKYAVEQARKLGKVKDVKGLMQFRRDLDKHINFNQNPDAALAQQQGVSRVLRSMIRDKTNSLVPGLKKQNNLYHDLSDIQDYALKAANRGNVEATSANGGLASRVLTSPTANTLKSKGGEVLQSVGRAAAGTGGPATQVTRYAKLQAPGNVIEAATTPTVQDYQQQDEQANQVDPQFGPQTADEVAAAKEDPTLYATDALHGFDPEQDPTLQGADAQGTGSLEEALVHAQELLGPGQTPATYLSYAKALQSGSKQNANQQKTTMALKNAHNVVAELTKAYNEVGGAQGAGTGQVRNALGKARIDQQARNYNDLRQAFLSRIARAFGEVGTLNEGDINRALGAIPDLADNKQTAARKLSILNSLLSKAERNNTGGSDLESILSQLQGAQ